MTSKHYIFTPFDYSDTAYRSAIDITAAKALGATHIETDNEENNPMYGLNMTLSFKPAPAWVDYEKRV